MKHLFAILFGITGALFAGCGSAPVATLDSVEVAACDRAVGGPFELPIATAVEAVPGYEQGLEHANLQELPDVLDLSEMGPLERTLVGYMLEVDSEALGNQVNRDDLLADGPMGKAVAYAFYVAQDNGWHGADTDTLRRGLQRFYACSRNVPLALEGLKKAVLDGRDLPTHTVESNAKNTTRRLSGNADVGVWFAETLVDGKVRETEVILSGRRRDGALDFLAYDEQGELMDRSRFETPDRTDISGAAPYVCIICHSSGESFFPDTVFPVPGQ